VLLFRELDERQNGLRTAETLVVRQRDDGLSYVKQPPGLARSASAAASNAWPAALKPVLTAPAELRDYRGHRVVAAGEQLRGLPWYVVVKADTADLLDGTASETRTTLALLAVSVAAGGLLFGLVRATRG
jgi:hypothetical protein